MASPHVRCDGAALVLIDHQVGTVQSVETIMPDTADREAALLGQTALAYKMPTVTTSCQEDEIRGPLHPILQQATLDAIEATGRRQLITAAVTTDVCLVFPAISAVEAGYEVLAVIDAFGMDTESGEDMALRRMERAGVWLTSINTMVAEPVQDWSTPEGGPLVIAMTAISPMLPVEWAKA